MARCHIQDVSNDNLAKDIVRTGKSQVVGDEWLSYREENPWRTFLLVANVTASPALDGKFETFVRANALYYHYFVSLYYDYRSRADVIKKDQNRRLNRVAVTLCMSTA